MTLCRIHVLVAEDDPAIQKLIRLQLEQQGHRVTVCSNGAEAVELVENLAEGLDVVVMDIQMPVLDGLEAIRRIRAGEASRHIPIICLSGTHAEAGLRAGADVAIAKPFTGKQLLSALDAALLSKHEADG